LNGDAAEKIEHACRRLKFHHTERQLLVAISESLDTPFWDFSVTVYERDGVADECLGLQERLNLDVNLLLFVAFSAAVEGVRLEMQDIAAANAVVADWHGEIVRTLRRARRALKPASNDADSPLHEANATLRAQVKIIELEAERIEQAMLWEWSRRQLTGRPRTDRDQALAANLRGVLEFYGVADGRAEAAAAVPHLLDAATTYSRSI
jgi:uncharacterized protein (TIGR02444 family)